MPSLPDLFADIPDIFADITAEPSRPSFSHDQLRAIEQEALGHDDPQRYINDVVSGRTQAPGHILNPPAPAQPRSFPAQVATDLGRTIGGGARDFAQATYNSAADIINLPIQAYEAATGSQPGFRAGGFQLPEVPHPEGVVPQLTRGLVQGGLGLAAGNQALRGAGVASTAVRLPVAGVLADLFGFDPDQGNLSTIVQQHAPNAVTEALATHQNQPWTNRARNAAEGLLLGGALQAGLNAITPHAQTVGRQPNIPDNSGRFDLATEPPAAGRPVEPVQPQPAAIVPEPVARPTGTVQPQPVVRAAETAVPAEPVVRPVEAPVGSSDISSIGNMGSGIADAGYEHLLGLINRGIVKEGGRDSPFLQLARIVRERVPINDIDDVRRLYSEFASLDNIRGTPQWQTAMRNLSQTYGTQTTGGVNRAAVAATPETPRIPANPAVATEATPSPPRPISGRVIDDGGKRFRVVISNGDTETTIKGTSEGPFTNRRQAEDFLNQRIQRNNQPAAPVSTPPAVAQAQTPPVANPANINQRILSIAGGDDNYNAWSNLRDGTDRDAFNSVIQSPIAQLETAVSRGIRPTLADINDLLRTQKPFANNRIRNEASQALFDHFNNRTLSQVNNPAPSVPPPPPRPIAATEAPPAVAAPTQAVPPVAPVSPLTNNTRVSGRIINDAGGIGYVVEHNGWTETVRSANGHPFRSVREARAALGRNLNDIRNGTVSVPPPDTQPNVPRMTTPATDTVNVLPHGQPIPADLQVPPAQIIPDSARPNGSAAAGGGSVPPPPNVPPAAAAPPPPPPPGRNPAMMGIPAEPTPRGPLPADNINNINLRRIDAGEDFRRVVEETAQRNAGNEDFRRGVQSEDQTRALADAMGMTPDDLLRLQRGQALNAEQAYAARTAWVAASNEVTQAANEVVKLGTDEARTNLARLVARQEAMQERIQGFTAEAGRALHQFNMVASAEGGQRARALEELLRTRGNENINTLAQVISSMGNNPPAVARAIRAAAEPNWWDRLMSVWINDLVSGPQTHAANVIGNTIPVAITPIEYGFASVIGNIENGIRRMIGANPTDVIRPAEVTARARGMAEGAGRGLAGVGSRLTKPVVENAARFYGWLTGNMNALRAAEDFYNRLDTMIAAPSYQQWHTNTFLPERWGQTANITAPGRATVRGINFAGSIATRALDVEDQFFQSIARNGEIRAQAMRAGLDRNLSGQNLSNFVSQYIANPPKEALEAARRTAEYATFRQPLGDMGNGVMHVLNSRMFGIKPLQPIVPFFRTPINLLKFAFSRSPFAAMMPSFYQAINAGGHERSLALSRMALGSALMGTAGYYALNGTVTGGGPTNPADRHILELTGWQPYSLRIGDTYYSYRRMEPFATVAGLAADFVQLHNEMSQIDADRIAALLVSSASQNLISKTWLNGVSNFMQALADPERHGSAWVNATAGSVVPNAVNQFAQAQDPFLREARTMMDTIRSRIPGQRETLQPRVDILGQEVRNTEGFGPDIASPIRTRQDRHDPLANEMARLRMRIEPVERNMFNVPLTDRQYHDVSVLSGEAARNVLNRIINSPSYLNASDAVREQIIKGAFTQVREGARGQVLRNDPTLLRTVVAELMRHPVETTATRRQHPTRQPE